MHEEIIETGTKESVCKRSKEILKRYKIPLSVGAAVMIVAVGALSHYKNERAKEELEKAIAEYQKTLVGIGGELHYGGVECSGIFSTDCTLDNIKVSILGQEQLSITSLRFGDVAQLRTLKGLSKGEKVKASIDIDARHVILPKPLMAQMVARNVSNAFQENTLARLNAFDLAFQADMEGTSSLLDHFEIGKLRIDNNVMPIEFSMKADKVAADNPDSMVLQNFSLSLEDRAISDVTFESVKSFLKTLPAQDQESFLKEFSLTPKDMQDKAKASKVINAAIAKQFEGDLAMTPGIVEKELTRAVIKILRGDAREITLRGENQNNLSLGDIQKALEQTVTMDDEAAQKYMKDKFDIEVKTN